MAECVRLKAKKTSICVGDLKHRITVQSRSLTSSPGGIVDYAETMADVTTTYAMIETPSAYKVFDSVSPTGSPVSHIFYIRYRSDITDEMFILFKDIYYDILTITNMNEENRFLKLDATRSGPDSLPASLASSVL